MSTSPPHRVTENGVVVVDMASIPGNTSGLKPGSFGHGNLEMLDVVTLLETAGITCCMVGVYALRYYGAWRVIDVRKNLRGPIAHMFPNLRNRRGKCACLQTGCREQCKR